MSKWIQYKRGGVTLHPCYPWVIGPLKYSGKLYQPSFDLIWYSLDNEELGWYYVKKDLLAIGDGIINKIFKNKKWQKKFFTGWRQQGEKCFKIADRIRGINLKKKDDVELKKMYEDYYFNISKFSGYALCIDAIDESLFLIFDETIKKKIKKDFQINFEILTTPIEPSYINRDELELLKIARLYKLEKKFTKKVNRKIKKYLLKYWWTKLGWGYGFARTVKEVEDQIKDLVKEKINIVKKIETIRNFSRNLQKQKNEILKKYKFDNNFKKVLQILEDFASWHDNRKEVQMKSLYSANLILTEIARRNKKYSLNDLLWMTSEEIIDIFSGNEVALSEIRRRKVHSLVFCKIEKSGLIRIEILSDKSALEREKKELGTTRLSKIKLLKGISASSGKVRGRVKVSYDPKILIRGLKMGEILVTGMTTPDFVPAMKKALAVITDEGGITCHAAIVSRELRIPCVVGTKIATQVLRDGDLVEVDADKGVIRKLK